MPSEVSCCAVSSLSKHLSYDPQMPVSSEPAFLLSAGPVRSTTERLWKGRLSCNSPGSVLLFFQGSQEARQSKGRTMNLIHLKYAVEVADSGSINKAAERLFMGQPNLSRAIKELESSLGITIFDRSVKGMVPTPEGETFLGYARQILRQIDEIGSVYQEKSVRKQRFSPYPCPAPATFRRPLSSSPGKSGRNPQSSFIRKPIPCRSSKTFCIPITSWASSAMPQLSRPV